ncbi:hypothetical protein Clacol_005447 [Clathrus columnatus]|uniref:Uncharacterized protein n=1 Tax=Clathrus columnatus TaxID=1419009 RepID=A0AAV5AH10_9AGAM|nr:hypothetical protein Clacol_005447 [Clathrus columnatus]
MINVAPVNPGPSVPVIATGTITSSKQNIWETFLLYFESVMRLTEPLTKIHSHFKIASLALSMPSSAQVLRGLKVKFYNEHLDYYKKTFDNIKKEITKSLTLEMSVRLTGLTEDFSDLWQDIKDLEVEYESISQNVAVLLALNDMQYAYSLGFMPEEVSFPETQQTIINRIYGWIVCNNFKQIFLLLGLAGLEKTVVATTIA